MSTDNDDIFSFGEAEEILAVAGKVMDESGASFTKAAEVVLYERRANDELRVLQNIRTTDGSFSFSLMPQRKYKLMATSGEQTASASFDTYTVQASEVLTQDLIMEKQNAVTLVSVATPQPQPTPPPTETKIKDTPKVVETKPINKPVVKKEPSRVPLAPQTTETTTRYAQNADNKVIPIPKGLYYKIQFESVLRFNPNKSSYSNIKSYGRLDTEYHAEKGWTRVMLADYFSLEEAYEILRLVKNTGFSDAFIVRYRNGRRITGN